MIDCTQVLEVDDGNDVLNVARLKVGSLEINKIRYDIFTGENIIGRDELSDIVLRSASISTKHAVIEVDDWDTHFIMDCGSTNKTRLGKVILKPNARYELQERSDIMIADLLAKYTKLPKHQNVEGDDDSGSETGSESMLNLGESTNAKCDLEESCSIKVVPVPCIGNEEDFLNDSSVIEDKKKDCGNKVVEESLDYPTDDEEDLFIPPSQSVREFNVSRQAFMQTINKGDHNQMLTEEVFGSLSAKKCYNDNSKDIFDMDTENQGVELVSDKDVCTDALPYHINTQYVFNTQTKKSGLVECEGQQNHKSLGVHSYSNVSLDQQSKQNYDLFEAETEMNDCEHDTKGSNMGLSECETQLNDSGTQRHKQLACKSNEVSPMNENGLNKDIYKTPNESVNLSSLNTNKNSENNLNKDLEMSELVLSRPLTSPSKLNISKINKCVENVFKDLVDGSSLVDALPQVNNKDNKHGQVYLEISNRKAEKSDLKTFSLSGALTNMGPILNESSKNICANKTVDNVQNEVPLDDVLTQVNYNLRKTTHKNVFFNKSYDGSLKNTQTKDNPILEKANYNEVSAISSKDGGSDFVDALEDELTQVNPNLPKAIYKKKTENTLKDLSGCFETTYIHALTDVDPIIGKENKNTYLQICKDDRNDFEVALEDKLPQVKPNIPKSTTTEEFVSENKDKNNVIEDELTQVNPKLHNMTKSQSLPNGCQGKNNRVGTVLDDELTEVNPNVLTIPYKKVTVNINKDQNSCIEIDLDNELTQVNPNLINYTQKKILANNNHSEITSNDVLTQVNPNLSKAVYKSKNKNTDENNCSKIMLNIRLTETNNLPVETNIIASNIIMDNVLTQENTNLVDAHSQIYPNLPKVSLKKVYENKKTEHDKTIGIMLQVVSNPLHTSDKSFRLLENNICNNDAIEHKFKLDSLNIKNESDDNNAKQLSNIEGDKCMYNEVNMTEVNCKPGNGVDMWDGCVKASPPLNVNSLFTENSLDVTNSVTQPYMTERIIKDELNHDIKLEEENKPSIVDGSLQSTNNESTKINMHSHLIEQAGESGHESNAPSKMLNKSKHFPNEIKINKNSTGSETIPTKSALTIADMDICSTIEGTMCRSTISSHCSTTKEYCIVQSFSSDTPLKPNDNVHATLSTKKPIIIKQPDVSQIAKLRKEYINITLVNNYQPNSQNSDFENPISSSTPFKYSNTTDICGENISNLENKNSKTPIKKRIQASNESPILPSSDELLAVADKTPITKYDTVTDVINSSILINRAQRIRKPTRKVLDSLDTVGTKPKDLAVQYIDGQTLPKQRRIGTTRLQNSNHNESDSRKNNAGKTHQKEKSHEQISDSFSLKPLLVKIRKCQIKESLLLNDNTSKTNRVKGKIKSNVETENKRCEEAVQTIHTVTRGSKKTKKTQSTDNNLKEKSPHTNMEKEPIYPGSTVNGALKEKELTMVQERLIKGDQHQLMLKKTKRVDSPLKGNQGEDVICQNKQLGVVTSLDSSLTKTNHQSLNENVVLKTADTVKDKALTPHGDVCEKSKVSKRKCINEFQVEKSKNELDSVSTRRSKRIKNSSNEENNLVICNVKKRSKQTTTESKNQVSALSISDKSREILNSGSINCVQRIDNESLSNSKQHLENKNVSELLSTLPKERHTRKRPARLEHLDSLPLDDQLVIDSITGRRPINETNATTNTLLKNDDKEIVQDSARGRKKIDKFTVGVELSTADEVFHEKVEKSSRASRKKIPKKSLDHVESCIAIDVLDKESSLPCTRSNRKKTSVGVDSNVSIDTKEKERGRKKLNEVSGSDNGICKGAKALTAKRRKNCRYKSVKSDTSQSSDERHLIVKDTLVFAIPHPQKKEERVKNKEELDVLNCKTPEQDNCNSTKLEFIQNRSRSLSVSSRDSDSVRSTPKRGSIMKGEKVLFTFFKDSQLESNVKRLGGTVVDCPNTCSVLVTDKVRRTVKFLCALGQGKPIVTPDWITKSLRHMEFEDPMNHLLRDTQAEHRFQFRLSDTLRQAKGKPLLSGYTVHATPSVKPLPQDIKSIVESCGGHYVEKPPPKWPSRSFIISHPDDSSLWQKLKCKGINPPIVAVEAILLGVLQNKLDFETHRIA